MKIICIGRNYADHAKELGNAIPKEPVIFLKPDTALLPKKNPFFIPDFTNDLHHELELVVRINRVGKSIEERFAHRYYNQITVGIDFTARDIQRNCKENGLPWEKAKAFDDSAPIGDWMDVGDQDVQNLNIELKKNGISVQSGNTGDMLFTVDRLIEEVSKYFTLKIGDLIFTGTPAGVAAVSKNDELEAFIEGQSLLKLRVK
ncbi:fumarylacetoacetate hydrolase family protein [Salibacteraceae bacterium]|nr:fumarylacetoacetate hydrolase family protein [Salibacteraceae bacterium]